MEHLTLIIGTGSTPWAKATAHGLPVPCTVKRDSNGNLIVDIGLMEPSPTDIWSDSIVERALQSANAQTASSAQERI